MPPSARDAEQFGKIGDELVAIGQLLLGWRPEAGGGEPGREHLILDEIAGDLAEVRRAVEEAVRGDQKARSAAASIAHEFREISGRLQRYGEEERA